MKMIHQRVLVFLCVSFLSVTPLLGQAKRDSGTVPKPASKNWVLNDLKRRSNDHFVFQVGYEHWVNVPDSIRMYGVHHFFGFNFYYDLPFRGNPHFSVAPGIGITLHRTYFSKVKPTLTQNYLNFEDVRGKEHSEINGLFYTNLEAQFEARYISNPESSERSFKIALGLKVGLTLDANTYQVNILDKDGNRLKTGTFEEHDTRFFQFPSTYVNFRIGYGVVGIFASYQLNSLFYSSARGPAVNPLNVGIVLSGF